MTVGIVGIEDGRGEATTRVGGKVSSFVFPYKTFSGDGLDESNHSITSTAAEMARLD